MQQTLDYLYALTRFGIKPGLETTKEILSHLGNPHKRFKSIHIGGTNGKGSTAAFTASVLQQAGYKVGMYTSPHLIKFNERIKINNDDISDEKMCELVEKIKIVVEENNIMPTFFEFTTVLAFFHFFEQDVDIAVIEVGLGGRLDSTNVLTPIISVITNISLDHTKMLGNSKEEIAYEKAGIIKEGIPLVTAEEDGNILKIFKGKAKEMHVVNEDAISEFKNKNFRISLLGEHQIKNACTSLMVVKLLQTKGFKIDNQAINKGFLTTNWPGRLQIFSVKPVIILDGAHNVAGMQNLTRFIETKQKRKVLILGLSKDKNIPSMVSLIVPLFENVIITQSNFKPAETFIIAKEVMKYCKNVHEKANFTEAIELAKYLVKEDELILVTGSIYLVGDVLKQFHDVGVN